jgi:hypothetical protein
VPPAEEIVSDRPRVSRPIYNLLPTNGTQMKRAIPITTLLLDVGGVLLTNGWDHHARRRAATYFKLPWAEIPVNPRVLTINGGSSSISHRRRTHDRQNGLLFSALAEKGELNHEN